jgi:hypothetical protein
MDNWFLSPDLLDMIEISKDQNGRYRVRSHPLSKPKVANPEEILRQLVLAQLRTHYHYPHENLVTEFIIRMGIAKKRADIGILNQQGNLETIIEIKQTSNNDSLAQLQSYMHASGVKYGALISLFDRQVFYRHPSGEISAISDLPTYQEKNSTEGVLIKGIKKASSLPIDMLKKLGISSLIRLSVKKSEIEIRGKKIIVTNTDLLDFTKLRKITIGAGVVLPSSIDKNNWDAMLAYLFENAPLLELINSKNNDQEAELIFQDFLAKKCMKFNKNNQTLYKDIYHKFTDWYLKEFSGNKNYLPSKKNISAQLNKMGFQRRKIGGQIYVYGLEID